MNLKGKKYVFSIGLSPIVQWSARPVDTLRAGVRLWAWARSTKSFINSGSIAFLEIFLRIRLRSKKFVWTAWVPSFVKKKFFVRLNSCFACDDKRFSYKWEFVVWWDVHFSNRSWILIIDVSANFFPYTFFFFLPISYFLHIPF